MPPFNRILAVCVLALSLYGCGFNNIPAFEEQAKADWAQNHNHYKRRADLIPNLVETVKGFAAQECKTLKAVVKARAATTLATLLAELLLLRSCAQRSLAKQTRTIAYCFSLLWQGAKSALRLATALKARLGMGGRGNHSPTHIPQL